MTRPESAKVDLPDYTGDVARQAVRHVWHHATQVAEYAEVGPKVLLEGDGVMVRDAEGNEYIDGTSILGVTMIGHGREEVADAMAAQAKRLEYGSLANGFSNVPAVRLATKLAEMTPGKLEVSYFCLSGSEANDTAIKMARQYWKQKGQGGKYKIIGRRGSYHGVTIGAASATGIPIFRTNFEPLVPGFSHVGQPYVYRSEEELGCGPEEVAERAARTLEQQILFEGPDTVAAFIAEPIQVPQAIKVPPQGYWERIQEICDRYDVLLIVDEVFNGFGRTGKMFGSEHFGIEPDIMTFSKGMTSGYAPLSAAIATREVFKAFWGDLSDAFAHGGTYSGHPVSCAAALANLEILERENLVERSAETGETLLGGLRELEDRPFVGNVSGVGLLTSVELVSDKGSKAPPNAKLGKFMLDRMAEKGLLGRYLGNSLYFYPPLTIEEEQLGRLLGIFRDSLDEAVEMLGDAAVEHSDGRAVLRED